MSNNAPATATATATVTNGKPRDKISRYPANALERSTSFVAAPYGTSSTLVLDEAEALPARDESPAAVPLPFLLQVPVNDDAPTASSSQRAHKNVNDGAANLGVGTEVGIGVDVRNAAPVLEVMENTKKRMGHRGGKCKKKKKGKGEGKTIGKEDGKGGAELAKHRDDDGGEGRTDAGAGDGIVFIAGPCGNGATVGNGAAVDGGDAVLDDDICGGEDITEKYGVEDSLEKGEEKIDLANGEKGDVVRREEKDGTRINEGLMECYGKLKRDLAFEEKKFVFVAEEQCEVLEKQADDAEIGKENTSAEEKIVFSCEGEKIDVSIKQKDCKPWTNKDNNANLDEVHNIPTEQTTSPTSHEKEITPVSPSGDPSYVQKRDTTIEDNIVSAISTRQTNIFPTGNNNTTLFNPESEPTALSSATINREDPVQKGKSDLGLPTTSKEDPSLSGKHDGLQHTISRDTSNIPIIIATVADENSLLEYHNRNIISPADQDIVSMESDEKDRTAAVAGLEDAAAFPAVADGGAAAIAGRDCLGELDNVTMTCVEQDGFSGEGEGSSRDTCLMDGGEVGVGNYQVLVAGETDGSSVLESDNTVAAGESPLAESISGLSEDSKTTLVGDDSQDENLSASKRSRHATIEVPNTSVREPTAVVGLDRFWHIKPSSGRDLGVFAIRNIPRGTRIMAEEPLMLLPNHGIICVPLAFARLTREQKAIFLRQHRTQDEERDAELAEYMEMLPDADPEFVETELSIADQVTAIVINKVNSFSTGNGRAGIFPDAARMNHSCVPNVYHCWNGEIGRLTVHATSDIEAGQEMSTSYTPAFLGREKRNDGEHLGNYGFVCGCEACDITKAFGRASVKRRRRLVELDLDLAKYGIPTTTIHPPTIMKLKSSIRNIAGALDGAKEIVNLLQEERVAHYELSYWLKMTSTLCVYSLRFDEARDFAKRAVDSARVCVGADHPRFREYVMQEEQVESKRKDFWIASGQTGVKGMIRV